MQSIEHNACIIGKVFIAYYTRKLQSQWSTKAQLNCYPFLSCFQYSSYVIQLSSIRINCLIISVVLIWKSCGNYAGYNAKNLLYMEKFWQGKKLVNLANCEPFTPRHYSQIHGNVCIDQLICQIFPCQQLLPAWFAKIFPHRIFPVYGIPALFP